MKRLIVLLLACSCFATPKTPTPKTPKTPTPKVTVEVVFVHVLPLLDSDCNPAKPVTTDTPPSALLLNETVFRDIYVQDDHDLRRHQNCI